MKIEGNFLQPDEIEIGLFMAYGEDEIGQFHMVTIGFIIFSISFIKYI
jgi:hypothetical protein